MQAAAIKPTAPTPTNLIGTTNGLVGECYVDRHGRLFVVNEAESALLIAQKASRDTPVHIGRRDHLELFIPYRSYPRWLDYLCRQMDGNANTLAERQAIAQAIETTFAYRVMPQLTADRFCRRAQMFVPLR